MVNNYKKIHSKNLYIFFVFLSLIIFFFSTAKVEGKAFDVDNIEITMPFEMDFNKNKVIDDGFKKAFSQLISLIVSTSDIKKIDKIKLNEIKGMIESFSIKEEKFINEIYYVNLGVSFNKKKIFSYLEKKNIFPSTPVRKKLIFLPIIIDENKKDLMVFSNNEFFNKWLNFNEDSHLIEYILPTEDLEDLNILKENYEILEQYDFKEITSKYDLKDSIVALIFKKEKEIRALSRISIMGNVVLKNQTFSKIDNENNDQVEDIIKNLKIAYEDYWKSFNQVNTSIKLPIYVRLKNSNNLKISNFEKILDQTDLIYNFFISKYDKDFTYYQIIFNGTPGNFLETMSNSGYNFDTQKKIWILQ